MEVEVFFVSIVRKYPQIWNSSHMEKKLAVNTQTLWEEITGKIQTVALRPLSWRQVRQKWRNIVNTYNKISYNHHATKKVAWPLWEAMAFYHQSKSTNRATSESNWGPVSKIAEKYVKN